MTEQSTHTPRELLAEMVKAINDSKKDGNSFCPEDAFDNLRPGWLKRAEGVLADSTDALDGLNPAGVKALVEAAKPFQALYEQTIESSGQYPSTSELSSPEYWVVSCGWEDLARIAAALASVKSAGRRNWN